MWVSFRAIPEPPALHLSNANIERVKIFKLLGTWHQDDLKWNKHVKEITRKASKASCTVSGNAGEHIFQLLSVPPPTPPRSGPCWSKHPQYGVDFLSISLRSWRACRGEALGFLDSPRTTCQLQLTAEI